MLHDIYNIFFADTVHIIDKNNIIEKIKNSYKHKCPLIIKVGFDPTSLDLHFGHLILFNKLSILQNLGHIVVFVIGDFTALIGDPSGRNKYRPVLSIKKIKENALFFYNQACKFLNARQTIFKYNSEWFNKTNIKEILAIASNFSLIQMLERHDFNNRFKLNKTIYLHEILYPLLQGLDSIVIKPDIEIGGTDQLFNLLAGRYIMKKFNIIPQNIITFPLLEGIDAVYYKKHIVGQKMSKSFNNNIAILDASVNQFKQIMSIDDQVIWKYYALLCEYSHKNILLLKTTVFNNIYNKCQLGYNLTSYINNIYLAQKSFLSFMKLFKKKYISKKKFIINSNRLLSIIDIFFCYKYINIDFKIEIKNITVFYNIYINNIKLINLNYLIYIDKKYLLKANKVLIYVCLKKII